MSAKRTPSSALSPARRVGIVDANHYVFVVVDGRSSGYSRGVTLTELAQILKDLGCTTAYNLDGGGSSAMYFNGELVNNPLGRGKERGLSDICTSAPETRLLTWEAAEERSLGRQSALGGALLRPQSRQ